MKDVCRAAIRFLRSQTPSLALFRTAVRISPMNVTVPVAAAY